MCAALLLDSLFNAVIVLQETSSQQFPGFMRGCGNKQGSETTTEWDIRELETRVAEFPAGNDAVVLPKKTGFMGPGKHMNAF